MLQKKFGHNTMLISQDELRRNILWVKDGIDTKALPLMIEFLKDRKIDVFYCSPYKRSMDTIADAAAFLGKEIITDERLREREKGPNGNNHGMF